MLRCFGNIFILLITATTLLGQTANFTIPASACLNQGITIDNTSLSADSYVWDFCQDGLEQPSTAQLVIDFSNASPSISTPEGVDVVNDDGNWYAFVLGRDNPTLYRVAFGASLSNATPIVVSLGNIGAQFFTPTQIEVVKEGGNWYGFITNFSNSQITRINFGSSLSNVTPTATDLGTLGADPASHPRGMDIVKEGSAYYGIISYWSSNKLTVLNFSSGLNAAPAYYTLTNTSSLNNPVGVSLKHDNGNWYGLVANYSSGEVLHLSFGANLFADPTLSLLTTAAGATDVALVTDGLKHYGFVETPSGLVRIDFSTGLAIDNTEVINAAKGYGGQLGGLFGLSFVKDGANWRGFTISQSNNKLHRINFTDVCSNSPANMTTSTLAVPSILKYSQAGTYMLELIASKLSGAFSQFSKSITIQNLVAPAIDFTTDNSCITNSNLFSATTADPSVITTWSWDFGDTSNGTSSSPSITHQYNAVNNYDVTLSVLASNSCINAIQKTVSIFNVPVANFTLPTAPTCTNQLLTFLNTSTFDNGSAPSWKWYLNGSEASQQEDFTYSFLNAQSQTVKLITSIPGCSSAPVEQTLSGLAVGPSVNFSYSNNCFGFPISFKNESSGSGITGHQWLFGDGATETVQQDPQHLFSGAATFQVKLIVNNNQGCANDKTVNITVNDQPLADFTFSTAVENLPVNFTGHDNTLADDAITDWNWDFNGMGQRNGDHVSFTFSNAGSIPISLTGSTSQGCTFTVNKSIPVAQSSEPSIVFSLANTACLTQAMYLSNSTVNAASYLWDFCHTDLESITATSILTTLSGASVPEGVQTVFEKGNYYSFVTSRDNNKIFRVNLGHDFNIGSTPEIVDLGVGMLSTPMDIKMKKENGVWFAFVINSASGKITRLRFGNGINNVPDQTTDLGNFGKLEPGLRGFDLVFDGTNWIGVVVNYSNHKVYTIKFGPTLDSSTTIAFEFTASTVLQNPVSVSAVKDGNGWKALVTSLSKNAIVQIDFGNDLLAVPNSSVITSIYNVSSPMEIQMAKEGLNFSAFIVTGEGYLHKLSFGKDVSSGIKTALNKGRFEGLLGSPTAIEIVRTAPDWKGLIIDYTTNKIIKVSFSSSCRNLKYETSTEKEPKELSYPISGDYAVELNAIHANGNISTLQKQVSVSTVTAPAVDFSISNDRCLGVENSFTVLAPNVTSQLWDFGDDATDNSNAVTVSHKYLSTGSRDVLLSVVGQNGCGNLIRKTVDIFNPPSASFTLPPDPHCTNQLYTFNNTSTFDAGFNPSWQWFVDDQQLSTDKELQLAFANTTDASVRLIASIPGCSSTVTQQMTSFIAGPVVDFSFFGKCDQEEIQFTSSISQPVTSLSWSFGDGNTNASDNPKNLYASPGQYTVVLSTVSPSGCNNSKTKTVTIFSNPKPDFLVEGAPNSCTNSLTKFTNQTLTLSDSEVSSWLWSFNPGPSGTSTNENPSYQFSTAGSYNVSLKAVTLEGCSGTIQKTISILQGPTATISNTPSCVGIPVNFSASGSGLDSYYWEMGSSYYTTPIANHTFNLAGTYNSKLTITSANNCQLTLSKSVLVPAVLVPDFSVKQNCVGYDAQLTDLTTGSDPVVQRDWEILGFPSKTGSPVSYNFSSALQRSVKLTVKSQAGCIYSKTKTINVVAAPVASFNVDPQSGGVPLVSQFTNTSINSTSSAWKFGDGTSESTLNSPLFAFTNVGEYPVELVASNAEGCESKASKIISALSPIDDVEIKVINYTTNPDGSLKVIITLQNNGNTILRNLPVDIDVSGITTLREIVPGPITPSTLYNLVLGSTFTIPEKLSFFCASSSLTNDVTPENNRACKELGEKISLLNSYPNPVKSTLFVNWIAPENETVTVEIIDLFGKTILSVSLTSVEGLNEYVWKAEDVENGLYILKIKSQSVSKTERILIAR